mmetsp:Transcript_51279/g.166272  ORF Transcript_51279/g.166272 Transcript_51279/m.166272 type:complete len:251 (+) Transcript_51279:204-956(+)
MRTSFSRMLRSCFLLCIKCCVALASASASSFIASASPMRPRLSASAFIWELSYMMSACTRLASASASAREIVSTRRRSMSFLMRCSWAVVSMRFTWISVSVSIVAVCVCSCSFTKRCSWFSSARFFLPFSISMVCSLRRSSSSIVMELLRSTSPVWYSCSRLVLSMALFTSVARSKLFSKDSGKVTPRMVQLEKTTPTASNFLLRLESNSSARAPRRLRTVRCVSFRTIRRIASSTAPVNSWSKCTAPSL